LSLREVKPRGNLFDEIATANYPSTGSGQFASQWRTFYEAVKLQLLQQREKQLNADL